MLENLGKMLAIQERIVDCPKGFYIVGPARKFVREGFVEELRDGSLQDRVLYLFSDGIIVSTFSILPMITCH
jgi:hypothetical protein